LSELTDIHIYPLKSKDEEQSPEDRVQNVGSQEQPVKEKAKPSMTTGRIQRAGSKEKDSAQDKERNPKR
jgi:hypothetical protein